MSAPATIIRPDAASVSADIRRSPPASGVCHHHAVSRHACAAMASASPGRSLMGRTASVQVSGAARLTPAAAMATGSIEDHGGVAPRTGASATNPR